MVYWKVVDDDSGATRNGSFCALTVGLENCASPDPTRVLRTSVHVTLDDQQRGAAMYRLQLSWDDALPAGPTTSVSEPFRLFVVPGAVTLLPVAITVIAAVWTKDVILSLYLGVYFASLLTTNYNPFDAFVRSLDTYVTFKLNFHHFDHSELDLRGHIRVRGAAFACLRLKLADIVLI